MKDREGGVRGLCISCDGAVGSSTSDHLKGSERPILVLKPQTMPPVVWLRCYISVLSDFVVYSCVLIGMRNIILLTSGPCPDDSILLGLHVKTFRQLFWKPLVRLPIKDRYVSFDVNNNNNDNNTLFSIVQCRVGRFHVIPSFKHSNFS